MFLAHSPSYSSLTLMCWDSEVEDKLTLRDKYRGLSVKLRGTFSGFSIKVDLSRLQSSEARAAVKRSLSKTRTPRSVSLCFVLSAGVSRPPNLTFSHHALRTT